MESLLGMSELVHGSEIKLILKVLFWPYFIANVPFANEYMYHVISAFDCDCLCAK